MSRIGKLPITVPAGVTLEFKDNVITVKGPKGELRQYVNPVISVNLDNNEITLTRSTDDKQERAYHGLYRSLINNMIIGVSVGYKKELELVGVGYRASVTGKKLEMSLGYSHPIIFDIPEGIDVKVEKQTAITVSGYNKELVGQVAAKLRSFRPPEPYLGKGVRYSGEKIRKKAGKSAGK